MLGDIHGSTAVFTAQRQSLQHAQGNQNHRCSHANRGVIGQQADDEGRQTHDHDGDEEGVFTANHVAQAAKHQRPKRPDDEASGESQQRENKGRTGVEPAEKLFGNNRCQRAIQIEVVPLKDGAQRRGKDDLPLLRRHDAFFNLRDHFFVSSIYF